MSKRCINEISSETSNFYRLQYQAAVTISKELIETKKELERTKKELQDEKEKHQKTKNKLIPLIRLLNETNKFQTNITDAISTRKMVVLKKKTSYSVIYEEMPLEEVKKILPQETSKIMDSINECKRAKVSKLVMPSDTNEVSRLEVLSHIACFENSV